MKKQKELEECKLELIEVIEEDMKQGDTGNDEYDSENNKKKLSKAEEVYQKI